MNVAWEEAGIWCGAKQLKPILPLLFNSVLNYTYSEFFMTKITFLETQKQD